MKALGKRTVTGGTAPGYHKQSGQIITLCGSLLFGLIVVFLFRENRYSVTPTRDRAFTSTRTITGIVVAPDGTLWVGTTGGVVRRNRNGDWQKFTRRDGLPSHEVRSLSWTKRGLSVRFPSGAATWQNDHWQAAPEAPAPGELPPLPGQTCATVWRHHPCAATIAGLSVRENSKWHSFPLPPSTGTHISALLPEGDVLIAAMFGDGLWTFDGNHWKPWDNGLPKEALEITTMARDGETLWIGTRNAGIWEGRGGQWLPHLQPDEPVQNDCEALTMYQGSLFVSTLEDGLAVRTPQGWGHGKNGQLSSDAPREMAVFGNRLIIRHGNGKLDSFDGRQWQRNLGANLPHKQATTLAADAFRFYVGQWGGWSEYDGREWTHYLDLPELQGKSITALYPDGDRLWIGTQTRGVADYVRATHTLTWHDEREGLPDDWITTLKRVNGTLYAGTFVGGLAHWEQGRWAAVPELVGENVTDIVSDDNGGVCVGTRNGVRHLSRNGKLLPLKPSARFVDSEAQALCKVPGGLWIGTRTGLYYLTAL